MIKIFNQSNSVKFTNQIIGCNKLDTFNNGYVLGKSHKTEFANGEITVVLDESVRNETIVIVSQPKNYADTFELFSTIDAARRSSAKEIIAIIPSLPHSRQERRPEGKRMSISARLYADMLETSGLDRLITMDVHTTAIEGFYKIPFDNIDPFDIFVEKIKSLNLKEPVLVSPDFGGMKRVKKYAKALGYPMAFINKERLKANEIEDMTLIGSVDDADIIMVDDMIDTGGTLLKAIELLYDNGANSLNIFATHGIFSNDGNKKLSEDTNIDNVFISNTLPVENVPNINTINVACKFHKALRKIII